ncbi:hypothetical protein P1X14_19605 [Sphingomonas sp. AOB5]|uniref:hypothetical protein n=1 Tax=Sphingomonas sp. AOB5 TaxID=3034017 RepID=UPI0023F8F011|nr:hypothetical protein [Sphingomonas sp. AOB5]MDF7777473.1 hypothetical protein [Sphingomonas sp. AOB5]
MAVQLVLKSIAVAFGAMVVNVAASFLWVFIYSITIAPGQDEAFYQAYAMRAAPWCSVIAGVPILFAAGWLLAKWLGSGGWRAGIGAGLAYVAIDFAIIAAMGAVLAMPLILVLSFTTKLAASALGGAMRRPG